MTNVGKNRLRSEVFSKQDILAKIYRESGHLKLTDYVNGWEAGKLSGDADIFKNIFEQGLKTIYSPESARAAADQLRRLPLLSTIDHLGLLNHPFFLNSNVICGLRRDLDFLIVLPTAGVSMNNSSWPGCLVRNLGEGGLKRYSLFGDCLKTAAALSVGRILPENVARLEKEIFLDSELSGEKKDKFLELIRKIFRGGEHLSGKDFTEQACAISSVLWREFFPQAPALIYSPLEKLVSRVLINISTGSSGHLLYKLFFTKEGWLAMEKTFQGSLGAFSSSHKGSFLFWGLNAKGRRTRLRRNGFKLSDADEVDVDIDAGFLREALETGAIYPTSLVCFIVLLYFNITAIGGFNQVSWLTNIKLKFMELLKEWGEAEVFSRVSRAVTDNFAESGLVFLADEEIFSPASGIDIFLQSNTSWWKKYQELGRTLTVRESIESRLPEIYRVITPRLAQRADLLAITDRQIIQSGDMGEKIRTALM